MLKAFKVAFIATVLSLGVAASASQAAVVSGDATRTVAAQNSSLATQVHYRKHRHWHRHGHRHCGWYRRCGKWGCRIVRRCHRH